MCWITCGSRFKNIKFNEWQIIGDENLIGFLCEGESVEQSFHQAFNELILISGNQSSRKMVDFKTVTLTATIFPSSKEIRLLLYI